MNTSIKHTPDPSWHTTIARYNKPRMARSIWQIINSVVPYLILWLLIVQAISISLWLAAPLILLASGFLVRIFIIFHDCGHGSFFKSKKLNVIVGKCCGILALTPYHKWTDQHREHHQTVGNLDNRGTGDVWTMTVEEYLASSRKKQLLYRLFRNPFFLFGIGGPLSFLVLNRLTRRWMNSKQKRNIYFTNGVLLAATILASWVISWQTFLFVQTAIMYFAAIAGVYLFYLQHQYDDVKWSRSNQWDYKKMALEGSSFFKLPAILRWFTGNIGYHHVHHLGPTIPNYNLPRCHNENALFQSVKPITFFQSFRSLKLRLWDEKKERVVSFHEAIR